MKPQVFFDRKFIPLDEANVPITTHALHYGTGCFEGIRAYYSKKMDALFIFRVDDHYKRMLQSCKILFIDLPYSLEKLIDITKELVKKNFEKTDLYIRPLAFKSDPAVGNFNLKTLRDSFLIYTVPLGRYGDIKKGIHCKISSWVRVSDNQIPPRGKITGSYVNTSLAKTESSLAGYDEALFLDHKGNVVEGSAENLFIVKNNIAYTPPISDDILQGVTRDTVIKIIKEDLNIEVKEESLVKTQLTSADEVFLVGTGAEILPVIEIDDRKIGDGVVGEITGKVQDIYNKLVHGEYPKYLEFLTKISS
ncbi:branched-chain amino acid transaminase [Candidatus Daviesbacteria bacterium]|nr:branched-chain amino acid transaminase [Candidatus Daviesbacteria bacterium]